MTLYCWDAILSRAILLCCKMLMKGRNGNSYKGNADNSPFTVLQMQMTVRVCVTGEGWRGTGTTFWYLRVSELEMQSLYWLVAGLSSGLGFQLGQNSFPSWQTLLVRHPGWASEVAEKGENF